MSVTEGTKHSVEIEVPVEQVKAETERVVADIQKRAKLPGFRPGKATAAIIRSRFAADIRQQVLENLLPKAFRERAEQDHLKVVGTPDVTDVHFHDNEPLRFKAEFEVAPEFELGEYRDIPVEYEESETTDDEVGDRINQIRERKAEYVNQDPRPLEDGDYAVVHLKSVGGVEDKPIDNDDMMLHIADPETFPEFTENLRGVSPGEEREFEVKYPDDYGQEQLAGKIIRFLATVKGVRKKEVPELNDEFAQDLGDYKNVEELRDAVRRSILAEKTYAAQEEAKTKLIDKLVENHEFSVPEVYIDRQTEIGIDNRLRGLAAQGVDPRSLNLDWGKLKANYRDKAIHDVKASLLLERIADAEAIHATQDEVDKEVQRIARQEREPVAATRKKLEENGGIGRIASHIRTEKTMNFLFENARKVPKAEAPAE
jgi:trigger factor